MQLTEFTVFPLSQRIFKLGLQRRTFSNSAFTGLFQNVLTFIPTGPEAQDNAKKILGCFFNTLYYSIWWVNHLERQETNQFNFQLTVRGIFYGVWTLGFCTIIYPCILCLDIIKIRKAVRDGFKKMEKNDGFMQSSSEPSQPGRAMDKKNWKIKKKICLYHLYNHQIWRELWRKNWYLLLLKC